MNIKKIRVGFSTCTGCCFNEKRVCGALGDPKYTCSINGAHYIFVEIGLKEILEEL
jgi:hypothetical protein